MKVTDEARELFNKLMPFLQEGFTLDEMKALMDVLNEVTNPPSTANSAQEVV